MLVKSNWKLLLVLVIIVCGYGVIRKRIWLKNIELEQALIHTVDLPSGFSPGEFINPYGREKYVQAKNQAIVQKNGEHAGSVGVYIYNSSPVPIDFMYNVLGLIESQEGVIPYEISGIGEEVEAVATEYSISIAFTRCHALGVLSLRRNQLDTYGFENLINHARNLDNRLKSLVCNN